MSVSRFAALAASVALVLPAAAAQPKVRTGIDVLKERKFDVLQGKRVGLITNPTGVDAGMRSTIDILFNAPGVKLVALFGVLMMACSEDKQLQEWPPAAPQFRALCLSRDPEAFGLDPLDFLSQPGIEDALR